MNYTSNYNLKKPEGTDFYDIGNENDNMDALDALAKELRDDLDALENTIAGMASSISTINSDITSLKTRVTRTEKVTQYDSIGQIPGTMPDGSSSTVDYHVKNGVCVLKFNGYSSDPAAANYNGTWTSDGTTKFPYPYSGINPQASYLEYLGDGHTSYNHSYAASLWRSGTQLKIAFMNFRESTDKLVFVFPVDGVKN